MGVKYIQLVCLKEGVIMSKKSIAFVIALLIVLVILNAIVVAAKPFIAVSIGLGLVLAMIFVGYKVTRSKSR